MGSDARTAAPRAAFQALTSRDHIPTTDYGPAQIFWQGLQFKLDRGPRVPDGLPVLAATAVLSALLDVESIAWRGVEPSRSHQISGRS
jgi:hypothetical protein